MQTLPSPSSVSTTQALGKSINNISMKTSDPRSDQSIEAYYRLMSRDCHMTLVEIVSARDESAATVFTASLDFSTSPEPPTKLSAKCRWTQNRRSWSTKWPSTETTSSSRGCVSHRTVERDRPSVVPVLMSVDPSTERNSQIFGLKSFSSGGGLVLAQRLSRCFMNSSLRFSILLWALPSTWPLSRTLNCQ